MFHPADKTLYDAVGPGELFSPRHVPEGIWLQLDEFTRSPIAAELLDCMQDEPPEDNFGDPLVDEEAQVDPERRRLRQARAGGIFVLRPMEVEFPWATGGVRHQVRRTGFTLTHADYLTVSSAQGQTLRRGVTMDCGRTTGSRGMTDEQWWLNLYVMFSRVTRMEDMLLLRPPPRRLLEAGPPASVLRALRGFEQKTRASVEAAMELAEELRWTVPSE